MKKILLTGGSRGIGAAIAALLRDDPQIELFAPGRAELDLLSIDSIRAYLERSPDFDGLVNTAGINILGRIDELDQATIDTMLQTNLVAPLMLIQGVAAGMKRKRQGKIVNFSSIWGCRSKEYRTLYSMSKFGISGMTRSLARELGPDGILVNAVAPGYVLTEMTCRNVPAEERRKLAEEIPLRRMAEPREIAGLVRFLLSDENTYMTGQTIIIDGGFLA